MCLYLKFETNCIKKIPGTTKLGEANAPPPVAKWLLLVKCLVNSRKKYQF